MDDLCDLFENGIVRTIKRGGQLVKQRLLGDDGEPLRAIVTQIRGDWKFARVSCQHINMCRCVDLVVAYVHVVTCKPRSG